jgi:hypothetical protein
LALLQAQLEFLTKRVCCLIGFKVAQVALRVGVEGWREVVARIRSVNASLERLGRARREVQQQSWLTVWMRAFRRRRASAQVRSYASSLYT